MKPLYKYGSVWGIMISAFVAGFAVCCLVTNLFGNPLIKTNYYSFVVDKGVVDMAKHNATGVYYNDSGVYCVYTIGRSAEAIQTTDYHEACHSFIYKSYKHFCVDAPSRPFVDYCGEYGYVLLDNSSTCGVDNNG